ncbi:hypothetical protein FHS89_000532 [Rubricella aquisinus]|uniref:Group 4 capsule polysaccharide lipoprotein gfcB, YjbF n=1 Tax=Rubricella aquisinus TaxID=2028108 RepID=A0A840WW82_9RHOB|nr:YjbF family lipoprotein [Rubricella aquisinus]MBB5514534.1 hypothetical protein [Rubricella aquisinus]
MSIKPLLPLLAVASLSACGTDTALSSSFEITQSVFTSALQNMWGPEPEPMRLNISPADIAAIDYDLMLVRADESGALATLPVEDAPNGVKTWASADGFSLTTRDGQIIGTRGFGADILVADVSAAIATLTPESDGGSYSRVYSYLDSENKISEAALVCGLEKIGDAGISILGTPRDTIRFTEICADETVSITNLYWIDRSDGFIWQSRQWISPQIGSLSIQILSRDAEQ